MIANEGNIIAVEYGQRDRDTMEENVTKFGLQNVTVLSEVTEQTMQGLPVPASGIFGGLGACGG